LEQIESQDPRFDGAIFIRLRPEARTIAALGLIGWNRIPDDVRAGSSGCPTNLSSHPVNWPCALPMPSATVSEARCIACSRPRPDHQSGLHRDEGCRRVQGQDDGAEPALADHFNYLKVTGWGGSFVDRSTTSPATSLPEARTTMKAEDATDTWGLALQARG
jgi:hypothetical protein